MALNEMYQNVFSDICNKHGDTLDMFCMDCEIKICLICGQQDHINHNWSRAAIILESLRSELQDQCDIIKNKRIPLLQADIQKIKSLKKENKQLATATEEKLLKYSEDLAKGIQRISDQLISSCKELKEENDDKFTKKEKEITTYLAKFESCFNQIQENELTDISHLLQLKSGLFQISEPLKFPDEAVTFEITIQEGDHVESILQSMIGGISLKYKNITLTKIFSAKQGERNIKYISPLREKLAWFREVGNGDHIMINIKENRTDNTYRYTKSTFKYFPEDFVTLKNGLHVFTCHSRQCVIKMSSMYLDIEELIPTTIMKIADISPLFPVGICLTAAGNLLLTAIDRLAFSKDIYSTKQPETSVVLVLSGKGKVKEVYQYANDEKTKLFFYPYRIAENNKEIFVLLIEHMQTVDIYVFSLRQENSNSSMMVQIKSLNSLPLEFVVMLSATYS